MTLVDGLRGVAAAAVVLPHAWVLFRDAAARPGPIYTAVFAARIYGPLGVQVFFVLSGFVIAYSLRTARVTPAYFARFVVRRSVRLDPPYWVALAVCCGVLWFEAHVAHDGARLPSLGVVLAHVAYAQEFFHCRDAINHTYWTLCIEVQLYLAFCASIGLSQWIRVPYPPVLTVAAVAALGWPFAIWPGVLPGLFLPNAYGFLAGAAAWWTVAGAVPRWAGMAAAGLAGTLAARHGDVPVWVTTATATLLAVGGMRGTLYRWLDVRPLQVVGRVSYGLYLLHNPVIALAVIVQRRTGLVSFRDDLAVLLVVYAVSLGAARAMHVWVERPCLRLARQLRAPGPGLPLIPA
jgi:peptidoglycan/LPS O-acetylase OafA/YrhL